jgi:antitoxin VapB
LSLNIKNSETHNLARQLAKSTGESLTEAVTQSLRERLERIRRSHDKGLAERLVKIGKDCARHLKGRSRSANYDDLLYDEKGLPK